MATNILTLDAADILFADFVQSSLALDGDQVIISHQDKGVKAPKFRETMVFVHTSQEQDEVQQFKERIQVYNPLLRRFETSQSSMRRLSTLFSFYGTNCDVLATTFKERLYFDSSKIFFKRNNLALIASRIDISSKIHEEVNGRWWERVDLTVGFYNSVTVDEFNNPFEGVKIDLYKDPDIHIEIGG